MKILAFAAAAMLFAVTAYAEPPQKSERGKDSHQKGQTVEKTQHGPPWMQHGQRPMKHTQGQRGMQQRSGQHTQGQRGMHRGYEPMMQHRGMHRGYGLQSSGKGQGLRHGPPQQGKGHGHRSRR